MANRLKIVTMIRKGFIIMAAFFALQKKSDQIHKGGDMGSVKKP
jgi:hypothetical protein